MYNRTITGHTPRLMRIYIKLLQNDTSCRLLVLCVHKEISQAQSAFQCMPMGFFLRINL